jgi:hypothetical protein
LRPVGLKIFGGIKYAVPIEAISRDSKTPDKGRAGGETLASIAKSYAVDLSMISRL